MTKDTPQTKKGALKSGNISSKTHFPLNYLLLKKIQANSSIYKRVFQILNQFFFSLIFFNSKK